MMMFVAALRCRISFGDPAPVAGPPAADPSPTAFFGADGTRDAVAVSAFFRIVGDPGATACSPLDLAVAAAGKAASPGPGRIETLKSSSSVFDSLFDSASATAGRSAVHRAITAVARFTDASMSARSGEGPSGAYRRPR